MCNNSKLDLAKMKTDIQFGELLRIFSQHIEWDQKFGLIKDNYSGTMYEK